MGLIDKVQTKRRVAPLSASLNSSLSGTPWLTTAAIPVGAIVRSVAFTLNLAGTRSDVNRGRQSALATAILSPLTSSSSKLWVETSDLQTWIFALGVVKSDGSLACDWIVTLRLADSTSTVQTTKWLVKDDVLANGQHHDALRNELLRTLAHATPTDPQSEADVGALSLKLAQPFSDAPPEPFEVSFAVVTSMDEPTCRNALRNLGHRVLEDADGAIRWGIGLPKNDAEDHVTLNFLPGRLEAHARIMSTVPTERRIAAYALHQLIARMIFLIKHYGDEAAHYQGPADWES